MPKLVDSVPCLLLVIQFMTLSGWAYADFQHDMNASWAQLQHQSRQSFPGLLWRWQWTKNTFSPSERHICMSLHGDRCTAQSQMIFKNWVFSSTLHEMKYMASQQQQWQWQRQQGTQQPSTGFKNSHLLLSAFLVFPMRLRDRDPHRWSERRKQRHLIQTNFAVVGSCLRRGPRWVVV